MSYPMHPALEQARTIIEPMFQHIMIEEQNILDNEKHLKKILDVVKDWETVDMIKRNWENQKDLNNITKW